MTKKKKKKEFLQIYANNNAHMSHSAQLAKISRITIYNWMKDDPEFEHAIKEIKNSLVEDVEEMVYKKIKDGNDMWMWRYLKAHKPDLWKEVTKQEVEQSGGLNLTVMRKTLTTDPKLTDKPTEDNK